MSEQIRVFSVDDHPLLREGIAALVNNQPDMTLIAEASTGAEAIQLFKQYLPDVTLMDLRLPDMSGIDIVIAIRSEFPEARIIMLTTFEGDVEIHRALQAGARGYLLKNMPPSELLDVIRQVHAGKKRIPPEIATSRSTCSSQKRPSRSISSTSWKSSAPPIELRPSRSASAAASSSFDPRLR